MKTKYAKFYYITRTNGKFSKVRKGHFGSVPILAVSYEEACSKYVETFNSMLHPETPRIS